MMAKSNVCQEARHRPVPQGAGVRGGTRARHRP
jgi:hypothetical protein